MGTNYLEVVRIASRNSKTLSPDSSQKLRRSDALDLEKQQHQSPIFGEAAAGSFFQIFNRIVIFFRARAVLWYFVLPYKAGAFME